MKTIEWLNKYWWYRLVKVIFIFLLISTCIISVWFNLSRTGEYQTDYLVVCNYGNRETFLANKDKGIYYIPTYYDYSDGLAQLPDETKEKIQKACGLSRDDASSILVKNLSDYMKGGPTEPLKLFDLTKTKVNVVSFLSALSWAILSTLVIILVAEIIRRAFYYIVLGSIKPNKK